MKNPTTFLGSLELMIHCQESKFYMSILDRQKQEAMKMTKQLVFTLCCSFG